MLSRGRVIKAGAATDASTLVFGAVRATPRGRVLDRRDVEARERAVRIVAEAGERAREIVTEAERASSELRQSIERDALAAAQAHVAAWTMALKQREAELDERALERSVALAGLLAERLLGRALELDPTLVVALARQVLAEARGAERVDIQAHPDDARVLDAHLAELGVGPAAVRVTADAGRARGSLRLETELGVLDATLGPELERLAAKLGEALQRGV